MNTSREEIKCLRWVKGRIEIYAISNDHFQNRVLCKIKQYLSRPHYFLKIKSYLLDRDFKTRVNGEKSDFYPIKCGVLQISVLITFLDLYLLCTSGHTVDNYGTIPVNLKIAIIQCGQTKIFRAITDALTR